MAHLEKKEVAQDGRFKYNSVILCEFWLNFISPAYLQSYLSFY